MASTAATDELAPFAQDELLERTLLKPPPGLEVVRSRQVGQGNRVQYLRAENGARTVR